MITGGDGKFISGSKLKMTEFSAFMDLGEGSDLKHLFVQIGGNCGSSGTSTPGNSSPAVFDSNNSLEDIDVRQISDKFPSNKDGLKELFDRGPQTSFFLVKFWADLNIPNQMMDDPLVSNAFYGVTCQFESSDNMVLTCSTKVCSFGKQVVEKIEVSHSLPPLLFS